MLVACYVRLSSFSNHRCLYMYIYIHTVYTDMYIHIYICINLKGLLER